MSRQIYANGTLVEEWNDETRTYTNYETNESRPYTGAENTQADAEAARLSQASNRAALEAGLANVITRALAYQADAQAIIDTTNQTINSSPAPHIKTLARGQKRLAGDVMRLARLIGNLTDSASTGNDN